MTKLVNKTAIVTGGAWGIGYAIAKSLAEAGASVMIADLSEQGEQQAARLRAEGLHVEFVRTDARLEGQVTHAVGATLSRYGSLDILVNNVGCYPRALLSETTEQLWDNVMTLNLKSMFLFSKAAVPYMEKAGGGAIVNLGSSHAEVGLPELFAYSVSKGAIVTMTKNLAGALASKRIRVNCVNPGWVATEKEIAEREANGQSVEWLQERGKQLPLGRMQTGEDTAALVSFLVSDLASQITGQFIHVDGGKSVSMGFDDRSHELI